MIWAWSNEGRGWGEGCSDEKREKNTSAARATTWYPTDSKKRSQGSRRGTKTSGQNVAGADSRWSGGRQRKTRSRRLPKKTRGQESTSTRKSGTGPVCAV